MVPGREVNGYPPLPSLNNLGTLAGPRSLLWTRYRGPHPPTHPWPVGLAGTMVPLEVYPRHRLHFLPQFHLQWWLVLLPTRDRPLSRQPLPGLPEGSLSYVLAAQELVIAVVAVGARQKIVDTWDEQYSPIFGGLMKIHLASSEPVYQNRGAIVGSTQPKWRTISIAGIAIQVFPIYGARKETARREAVVTTVGG